VLTYSAVATDTNNEDEEEHEEEHDNGYSDYINAVKMYKNDSKMKGGMSKRYD
jgi:hypothetical protein